MAIRGSGKSGTGKAPLNVSKGCISPRRYNISTFIAVAAIVATIVLAVFIALPRSDTWKVNTTVSSSFYTKTWDGASYIENSSFYPNTLSVIVLFYDQGLKIFLDDVFMVDPLAIVNDTAFENETFGRGLIFFSMPWSSGSNVSIKGVMESIGIASGSSVFMSIAVGVNDDLGHIFMISGGFEWHFKFLDAISGVGIGKALYDTALPYIFTGNTDILLEGGFYKNSTTSGLYAIANGVATTIEEQWTLI